MSLMSRKENQSKDEKEFVGGDVFKISSIDFDKPIQIRFLDYIGCMRSVWVPTMGEDKETGKTITAFKRVVRPKFDTPTIFERLATAERKAHIAFFGDDKNFNSQFKASKKFWYYGIDRSETKPVVKIFEVPQVVFTFLKEKENMASPAKSGFLRHGPFHFYDILITKTIDKSKSDKIVLWMRTKYDCEIEGNLFTDKVNAEVWIDGSETAKNAEDFVYLVDKKIFTEDEIKVIESFKADTLEGYQKQIIPLDPEGILEFLEKNPIFLQATRKGGTPIFIYQVEFRKELEKLAIEFADVPQIEEHDGQENQSETENETVKGEDDMPPEAPPMELDNSKEIKADAKVESATEDSGEF